MKWDGKPRNKLVGTQPLPSLRTISHQSVGEGWQIGEITSYEQSTQTCPQLFSPDIVVAEVIRRGAVPVVALCDAQRAAGAVTRHIQAPTFGCAALQCWRG